MTNDHENFAVVTGAGSGIGRAVALELNREALTVLAVGRRLQPLQETVAMASRELIAVSADVGTEAGRAAIVSKVGPRSKVQYLVHAAGIQPIERLTEITPASWRHVMTTNLDGRLFLTQSLIPRLSSGGRVLFVGSLSATTPRKGATTYCVSKAASFMLQECLKLELAERGILVTSAIPSPANTALVQSGMAADPDVFPDGAEYARLGRQGRLIEPAVVGRFYRWLLTETDDESYSANQWDIQDAGHHKAWLGSDGLYNST